MRIGPIILAALIAGATYAGYAWIQKSPVPTTDAAPKGKRSISRDAVVAVKVAPVATETVPVYREGIGNVQALNAVVVRSQVDGRLLSVEFTEGQTVKKGDVLARIDPVTFQAQLDQAVAKRAQDQATLNNARLDLQRYQRLAQTNAVSKQQADQQAAQVAQLEAQVKSDDAAIANARAIVGYTTIVSPLDGRTGLRQVDPGNIVHASDSGGIVSITQVQPIAVVFTLPQRDLAAVNEALAKGAVPVEVMAAERRTVVAKGTLQTIDNQVDVSTGTIRLKATFPNEEKQLWPGQFVSARVVVETRTDAKVIPTPAVRRGPSGTFVYLVDDQSRAVVRPVEVLLQDEARAVIGTGLNPGERVITAGFMQLNDGRTVRVADDPVPSKGRRNGAKREGDGADASGGNAPAPGPATDQSGGAVAAPAVSGGDTPPPGEKRKRGEGRRRGGKGEGGAGPSGDGKSP